VVGNGGGASVSNRIALGTAQLGLNYGIANRGGRVRADEARQMLSIAQANGVDTLDTAIAYGDSEARLGELGVRDFKVVSKVPAAPVPCPDLRAWMRESVMASLGRLRIGRLYAVLLHRPMELLAPSGDSLWQGLMALKLEGMVQKIGVSVYNPGDLEALVAARDFDLVQAPLNIFDRRFARSRWLSRLHDQGVEIHTRSAFLQGLLLMRAQERPTQFDRWRNLWSDWDGWLQQINLTAVEACLGFVLAHPEVDRVVVGADGSNQLAQLLENVNASPPMPPDALSSDSPDLIDPSRWGAP
jgi:aryl-alcohol dehydrogenase-like predicted oxidoreductase